MKKSNSVFIALLGTLLSTGMVSADLIKAVGDFQPRFKPGAGGNGPTDSSQVVSATGVHTITYTGTIADFTTGAVDNARPFIGFDQGGAAATDFVYIDNILMTVGGNTIWDIDFESSTVGDTSGNNSPLPGTEFETANTMSSRVVDASTDPAIATAFTSASGNFAVLSTDTNAFSAVRPDSSSLTFASVPDSTAYSISFDIYIPAAIPEPSSLALMGMGFALLLHRRRK